MIPSSRLATDAPSVACLLLFLAMAGCQSPKATTQLDVVEVNSASDEGEASEDTPAEFIPVEDRSPTPIVEQRPILVQAEVSTETPSTDRSAAGWAAAAMVVERTAAPVESSPNGAWVRMRIPVRLRIDRGLLDAWIAEFTAQFDDRREGVTRMLSRGEVGTSAGSDESLLPEDVRGTVIHVDRIAALGPERNGLVRVGWSMAPGWGGQVHYVDLPIGGRLTALLAETVAPQNVEMLAKDAVGNVIFGARLPLIPCGRVMPGAPQPLVCPWWIRDRTMDGREPSRWRNAQQWLAPDLTLAAAMAERPEMIGDVVFLPMFGWQAMSSRPPVAVGALELTIDASIPAETAPRISSFVFELVPLE